MGSLPLGRETTSAGAAVLSSYLVALCHTTAALLYMKIKLFDLYQVTAVAGTVVDPLPVPAMSAPQAVVRAADLSHRQTATERSRKKSK